VNCEVGVTRATDKECCIYAENPYDPLPEGEEPYSHTENYRIFEGVLKIDGKLHLWKAYPVRRYGQSSDEEYQAEYGYNVRVDLADWRKRKDAGAIQKEVIEAITAEQQRLDTEKGDNNDGHTKEVPSTCNGV
jgi:hypothetical protein